MSSKILAIASLIGIGVLGRLVPHIPNATPITALALTASKHIGRVWSIAIPLSAMLISDAIIGFYDWKILASVYISFALIGVIGFLTRRYSGVFATGLLVLCSSLVFFLITNFAVWLFSPWYEKSIWGLLYSYELGIPFLRNMFIGDLAYSFVLLGVFNAALVKEGVALARMKITHWLTDHQLAVPRLS